MNKEIKTLGYLLTHYTNSQCYDQYIPLTWLKEQIEKEMNGPVCLARYEERSGLQWVLSLLEET